MALTKCNECGKEVSEKADKCPHCGAPTKSRFGCLSVLLAFLLIGVCSEYQPSKRPSPSGCQSEEKRLLDQAQKKLEAGHYREAIKISQSVLDTFPNQSKALRKEAEIKLRRRDGPPLLSKAEAALTAKKFDEAITLTNKLESIGAFPEKIKAIRAVARRQIKIKNSPKLLKEAKEYFAKGMYEWAIDKAEEIPVEAPEYQQARNIIIRVSREKAKEAEREQRQIARGKALYQSIFRKFAQTQITWWGDTRTVLILPESEWINLSEYNRTNLAKFIGDEALGGPWKIIVGDPIDKYEMTVDRVVMEADYVYP